MFSKKRPEADWLACGPTQWALEFVAAIARADYTSARNTPVLRPCNAASPILKSRGGALSPATCSRENTCQRSVLGLPNALYDHTLCSTFQLLLHVSWMCQKRTYTLSGEDYELLDAPTPHARISWVPATTCLEVYSRTDYTHYVPLGARGARSG